MRRQNGCMHLAGVRGVPGVHFGRWMLFPQDSPEIAQPVLSIPLDALQGGTLLIKPSGFLCVSGVAHGAGRHLSGGCELNA